VGRHFGAAVEDDVDGVEVASPRSTLFSGGQTADVAVKPVHAGVANQIKPQRVRELGTTFDVKGSGEA